MKLSLRPYPGDVIVCKTRKKFIREHRRLFGNDDHGLTASKRGLMVGRYDDVNRWPTYIIWAETTGVLAHELAHVIFSVFDVAGIPTNQANDEVFCYLLEQLMSEALS